MSDLAPSVDREYEAERETSPQLEGGAAVARPLLAVLGILFVGIAAAGVLLPGIPTVGPLIIASVLLTRSSPALEQRLIRNRFFARYLHYLDGTQVMPPRAKAAATGLMWTSILISSTVLYFSADGSALLPGLLVAAGIIGTVFIIRHGRGMSRTSG